MNIYIYRPDCPAKQQHIHFHSCPPSVVALMCLSLQVQSGGSVSLFCPVADSNLVWLADSNDSLRTAAPSLEQTMLLTVLNPGLEREDQMGERQHRDAFPLARWKAPESLKDSYETLGTKGISNVLLFWSDWFDPFCHVNIQVVPLWCDDTDNDVDRASSWCSSPQSSLMPWTLLFWQDDL